MSRVPVHPVESALPDRLHQRLRAMGLTVVSIAPDGRPTPLDGARRVERLILESPQFVASVRPLWADLSELSGRIAEIWPGVFLVPLPLRRRRRAAPEQPAQPFCAVLLLGQDLLTNDQFRLVCGHHSLDYQAAVAAIAPTDLAGPTEVQRVAAMLTWMREDSLEIDRRTGELGTMTRQLGESYEELSLLYKLSTNMTVNQPPAHFLTEACREVQQVLGLRWMALLLADGETRLNELAGRLFTAGVVDADTQLLKRVGAQLILQRPDGTQPSIIDDTRTLGVKHLPRLASELMVVSLLREDKTFGILFGGDKLDGSHISSVDSKLCNSLANSMSIFLENMMLYEDMQGMFMGTLHALTNSIDAKDSYTHGHSERVALMSRKLAEAAGLDAHTVERVYIAGLVHDVGKIGVPEAVLCKPGHLTEEEFALIKLHPEVGARILKDIRQMQDLIPGVLYHHERWDGRGYPHGLSRQDIPLFGRLIGLADSFDAMSSNRTYRQAMDHQQVIHEIRRCAGSQFDPELARIFVDLDFAPFYQLIEHHQKTQGPAAREGTAG